MPVEGYKEHLELTLSIGCQAQCQYCPQDLFTKTYLKTCKNNIRHMTLDMAKKYLKTVPKKLIISMAGFSEPLTNPEVMDIFEWIKSDGREVEMNTTLYKVKRETLRRLMNNEINLFQLHLPDDSNLTEIVVDEEYLHSLKYVFNKLKSKTNTYTIVTCLGNLHPDVKEIVDKHQNLVNGMNVGQHFINDRAGLITNGLAFESRHLKGEVHCCKTYRNLHYMNILPDGRVTLCCMDWGLNNIVGDLNDESYEGIVKGNDAEEIRRKMTEYDNDLICRNCEFAVSGEPPSKYPELSLFPNHLNY